MKKAILASLLCCAAFPAFAGEGNYGVFEIGQGQYSNSTGLPKPTIFRAAHGSILSVNQANNATMAVEVGGFFASEVGVQDSFGKVSITAYGFGADLVGAYPLATSGVSLTGSVGLGMNLGSLKTTGFYAGNDSSNLHTTVSYSLGAQYKLNERAALFAKYSNLGSVKTSDTATGADLTAYSGGISYKF